MIAIVVSEADRASEHIGEHLLDLADWESRTDDSRPPADGGGTYHVTDGFEMRTFEALHLHLEGAATAFDGGSAGEDDRGDAVTGDEPDLLVFASRHSGETGPLLTAHVTGNFADAEFGGEPRSLAEAPPNAVAAVVPALAEHAPEGYDVGVECTHHGPSHVGCPSMFVEVGSAEPQWEDPEAARAVARAILDLRDVDPRGRRAVVGFGGGHYAPRFTRVVRETPWAVGHVAADWALDAMGDPGTDDNRAVVREAFDRSGAERALLDGDHPDLAAAIEAEGYEVVSETWIREVGDRPLDLVASVEGALGSVAEGVRFGDRVPGDPEGVRTVALPAELLGEAQGTDPDATRSTVEAHAVAFGTRDGGTRAEGRAAFADPGDYDALVDDLAGILRDEYGSVDREEGAVVAVETAFVPELAREAGVREGPAFGRLADGQSVEVEGRTVHPEEVHRERERRFPVRSDPPPD
ncbi:hypothetical protein BRD00_11980 [Halobacteriales archaeon QS_8_69_26]|nr:MAG: hypothetical protein BRD00_11980 [Halobacteriales archaeon QS_8_69_26]